MNIVTTTCVYPKEIPEEERLIRLAKIGFSCLDLALDGCFYEGHPLLGEDWKNWVLNLQKKAESLGVRYTHSHSWGNCGATGLYMTRGLEVCEMLEIPYTVVHPIHMKADGSFFTSKDEFISVNAAAVRPLVQLAEKHGVTMLVENILWEQSSELDAITGLVEAVNSPFFGWCFDTG
ncbi:MAG: TIM barrel protein, partial [Clostridia bacterium]|nr:TIM barrel protein [Clostridia bacterium]